MKIDWDENKNRANMVKHGVSFEEAQTVFYDPLTKIAADPDHSDNEDRFVAVGHSSINRKLIVIHYYREKSQLIRIISARKLNRGERRQYEEL